MTQKVKVDKQKINKQKGETNKNSSNRVNSLTRNHFSKKKCKQLRWQTLSEPSTKSLYYGNQTLLEPVRTESKSSLDNRLRQRHAQTGTTTRCINVRCGQNLDLLSRSMLRRSRNKDDEIYSQVDTFHILISSIPDGLTELKRLCERNG